MEAQAAEIAEMCEPGRGMGEHERPIEHGGIEYQWMVPERKQDMTVQKADQRAGASASGTVKAEKCVHDTGRQGNMWQEHIVKQCPCHNGPTQENTSQIK